MEENHTEKQPMEQTATKIDFVPPEHSYLSNQQFNSAFFQDHCEEQYLIQRAFNAGNFTSLRKNVPNQLKHGAILEQRLDKVRQNLDSQAGNRNRSSMEKQQERKTRTTKRKMEQIGQLGYFQIFPYKESLYNIEHELKLREMDANKMKQYAISPLDFRPSGFDKKMKYQNPFSYTDRLQGTSTFKEEYLYPFHIPEDTYDRFHESQLRHRIIQEGAKIAGQFIPASNQKSLTKVTRSKAGQLLKELQEYIKKLLPNLGFFIGMSKRDHIDILYEPKETENSKLQLVMSRLCQSETLSKFMLRRNTSKWGKIGESGYLEYCVLPPWVKDPQQKLTRE